MTQCHSIYRANIALCGTSENTYTMDHASFCLLAEVSSYLCMKQKNVTCNLPTRQWQIKDFEKGADYGVLGYAPAGSSGEL